MTAALTLLGYSLLLAITVPRLLHAAGWVDRAPRLAIIAWQVTTVSILTSVIMAGVALTVPTVPMGGNLAEWLNTCLMALREQYASPGGVVTGAAGAALALAVTGRVGWSLTVACRRMVRERDSHRRTLDIVGQPDHRHGFVILESDQSVVYCLPGRRRRTVVTRAALGSLDDRQLRAVLAHERAHLRERHDLVLLFSAAIAAAFPFLRIFRTATTESARLVELRADDIASVKTDRLTLAEALLSVVSGGVPRATPGVALGAGNDAAARVRRLMPPRNPVSRTRGMVGSVAVAAALVLPMVILSGPAAVAAQHPFCPADTIAASSATA